MLVQAARRDRPVRTAPTRLVEVLRALAPYAPGHAPDAAEMGRAGARLYAPGGALVLLTLAFPHPGANRAAMVGVALVALAVAAVLWRWGGRVPAACYPLLTALGSGLISLLIRVGGDGAQAYGVLYVWAVLFAFYFYRPAQAVLQVVLSAAGCALAANLGPSPASLLLLIVCTAAVAGSWMRTAVRALSRSESTFRLLFDDNPLPMYVCDRHDLRFLAVNDAAVLQYGWSRAEFLSMSLPDIRPATEHASVGETVRERGAGSHASSGWHHLLKDGTVIDVEVTAHPLTFDHRDAIMAVAVNVTDRVSLERELRHQAFHDSLTGIPNRALLFDRLQQAIRSGRRGGARPALLLLDLDEFKTVNDTLGHLAGDQLLRLVADRLSDCVRESDTVGRLGGDEFAIIIDRPASAADAEVTARRILAALQRPFTVAGRELKVTATAGIAVADQRGITAEDLLRRADVAMYSVKGAGRDSLGFFSQELDDALADRAQIQDDLGQAIRRGEITVVYQPQLSLVSGRVVGVEALARWHHPVRGSISPERFIPIAEAAGLVTDLDALVLRAACEEMRALDEEGFGPLRLAVNISGRDLRSEGLVDSVAQILEDTTFPPTRLELELTESATVSERRLGMHHIAALRQVGIRIAIDDFGTGYSMLTRLRELPVDKLKVDRSFVCDVATDDDARTIVRSTIEMGHRLGLVIVAEGVEDGAVLATLQELGCDSAQGYAISAPLTETALRAWLREPHDRSVLDVSHATAETTAS